VVAQILRLKLLLVANAFRRTPLQILGLVVGLFYGLGTAGFVAAGLFALRFADVEFARSVTVVLGIDDILDPRRFSLFGMSNTTLALSVGVASLVSVPALVIAIMAIGQVSTWSRGVAPLIFAIIGAVLIVLTSVLSARVSTSLASMLLSTRRSRQVTTIVGFAFLVGALPLISALASVDWRHDGLVVLDAISRVAQWTPLGSAWAMPADAIEGNLGAAFAKLAISLVWLAALALAWRAIVATVLVTPQRQAQARKFSGLGWFDRLPRTPTGAIAARTLTYWARDSRYLASLVIIPLVPAIMMVVLYVGGVPLPALALLPVPIISLFLAWAPHNDVAFDNTAIWLHLTSSTTGRADRIGRIAPTLVIGLIVVIGGSILSVAINGDWALLPSLIGISSCILLCGLGLSSMMSARFPYPAVRPGDSPFSQPQAGGSAAGLIQGLSFFGILLFSGPSIAAATIGLFYGFPWPLVSLALGLVVGVPAFVFGVRTGSRIFERRLPEILVAALRN
jgi:ABC-2 type transport system permease protein